MGTRSGCSRAGGTLFTIRGVRAEGRIGRIAEEGTDRRDHVNGFASYGTDDSAGANRYVLCDTRKQHRFRARYSTHGGRALHQPCIPLLGRERRA